ncbi:hypothetical protein [Sphingomonas sp. HMP6]|uniref:hypothetical protein n=1 Tax=Sphingomonas sp. HMP6 TaxID=1517551 RepID=UPI001596AF2E|nr:hypothetical protein [Sphingomonas sp. HMP6]
MPFRVFGLVCVIFGHRRNAESRRSENGSVFATCARCSSELYREPVRGKWRAATAADRHPRGFSLTEEREPVVRPKKLKKRSRRH